MRNALTLGVVARLLGAAFFVGASGMNDRSDRRGPNVHRVLRLVCAGVLAGMLAGAPLEAADLPSVESYGKRIEVKKEIVFDAEAKPPRKLDLYLPAADGAAGAGPHPLVVCWFGGGFTGGNRANMARVCALLADRGIAAAAPDYFLADLKQDQPGWPTNLHDAKCAVRFLRAHARDYRVDERRVAGLGSSSGAYLAMMVAFTSGEQELEGPGPWREQSSRLSAVVNIAGVCDRRQGLGTGTEHLLGKGYPEKPELRRLASPVVHITSKCPPVYTLHGEADTTVHPDSARQLDEALAKAGVQRQLKLVPKLGHNPLNAETMAEVAQWLEKRLAPAAGP